MEKESRCKKQLWHEPQVTEIEVKMTECWTRRRKPPVVNCNKVWGWGSDCWWDDPS